jgi:hypothetical protein
MENEFDLTPGEAEMERRLHDLQLTEPAIDAHAIWYEAGVRRGRRWNRAWRAAAVASLAIAVGSFSWRSNPGPAFVKLPGPSVQTSQVASESTRQVSKTTDQARLQDVLEACGWNRIAATGTKSGHMLSTTDLSAPALLEQLDSHKDILNLRS